MSPLAIASLAFACIFGGILTGIILRHYLPEPHLSQDSRDAVKLGIGMISALTALVLGLLTASAKNTSETASSGLRKAGVQIIMLDHVLARYGSETAEARDLLRRAVSESIQRIWPEDRGRAAEGLAQEGSVDIEAVHNQLIQFSPRTDAQRLLQSRALQISADIIEGRWLLLEQIGQSSLPLPFLVVLVFWLTFIFATYGLFSPYNPTVIVVLIVCALSAAGSLFLILELDTPYGGLIKVSSAPLRYALIHLCDSASGICQ